MKNLTVSKPQKSGEPPRAIGKLPVAIIKPSKMVVTLAEGLRWLPGAALYQIKKDGRFWPAQFDEFGIITEKMPDGTLWAHTLVSIGPEDLRRVPLRETMPELRRIVPALASCYRALKLMPEFNGGEGLEALFANGEEGGVAKCLDSPPGTMLACKRSQVFYCVVTDLDPYTGGVHLADRDTFEPRGKMPLRGGKFERVRVGSVLKVEAYGLTAKGLLREARPDHDGPDSWLVSA